MELEQSSLMREVQEVLQSGSKPVHYTWKAHIHAGNQTFQALKVLSKDTLLEFDTKYAEEVMLQLAIPMGVYAYQIHPFEDELEITLYRHPLGEVGDFLDDEANIQSQRYAATLVNKGNVVLEGNGKNTPSQDILDLANIATVEFQLISKAVQQLSTITVGMILKDVTVENAVKGILTEESKKINVEEGQVPQGVTMVPAANENVRDHIVIPHGTRLIQIPKLIQEKCGGIYSAGLGYFLHQNFWHLYPCFDTQRFNEAAETVTVINVPQQRFSTVERTYKKVGSNLTILATGEVKVTDLSNSRQLNEGNGVRFADAKQFMGNFVKTENNKTIAARARNMSEFIATKRDDEMNHVRLSNNPITSNPYQEYSKLAQRNGIYFSMVWENSDQSLIVPGMMAKILYLEGDEIKEVQGSLLKVHHYDKMAGEGLTSARYHSHSVLVFFASRVPT